MDRILRFLELTNRIDSQTAAARITAPKHRLSLLNDEIEQCWAIVEPVASRYGYTEDFSETKSFSQVSFI